VRAGAAAVNARAAGVVAAFEQAIDKSPKRIQHQVVRIGSLTSHSISWRHFKTKAAIGVSGRVSIGEDTTAEELLRHFHLKGCTIRRLYLNTSIEVFSRPTP
jgi:hypothetical protein